MCRLYIKPVVLLVFLGLIASCHRTHEGFSEKRGAFIFLSYLTGKKQIASFNFKIDKLVFITESSGEREVIIEQKKLDFALKNTEFLTGFTLPPGHYSGLRIHYNLSESALYLPGEIGKPFIQAQFLDANHQLNSKYFQQEVLIDLHITPEKKYYFALLDFNSEKSLGLASTQTRTPVWLFDPKPTLSLDENISVRGTLNTKNLDALHVTIAGVTFQISTTEWKHHGLAIASGADETAWIGKDVIADLTVNPDNEELIATTLDVTGTYFKGTVVKTADKKVLSGFTFMTQEQYLRH